MKLGVPGLMRLPSSVSFAGATAGRPERNRGDRFYPIFLAVHLDTDRIRSEHMREHLDKIDVVNDCGAIPTRKDDLRKLRDVGVVCGPVREDRKQWTIAGVILREQ